MKKSDQNIKKSKLIQSSQSTNPRKFNYIPRQNSPNTIQQSTRYKILQTISQQALSQGKGSTSNRSQTNPNSNRIYKNLSQRLINQNRSPQFKTFNVPIRNIDQKKHGNLYYQDGLNPKQSHKMDYNYISFQKKPTQAYSRISQPLNPNKPTCYQCAFYTNKIAQLQSSYELLLQAKNQQLQECKIIIIGLQQKMRQIQKRSLQQIQKNKKFRCQIQKRNTQQVYIRQKQFQIIEYLKNRQIVLLEQMKQLQTQQFVKQIKKVKVDTSFKDKQSLKKQSFNSITFNSEKLRHESSKHKNKQNNTGYRKSIQQNSQQQKSIGEYSAKTFSNQQQNQHHIDYLINTHSNKSARDPHNFNNTYGNHSTKNKFKTIELFNSQNNKTFNSNNTKISTQLIERIPLSQITKKNNQIQTLKDDLLLSQIRLKIQQTKNLQTLLNVF